MEIRETNYPEFKLRINRTSPEKSWTKIHVEVLKNDAVVFEYDRNYGFLDTFWLFEFKKELYALYSKEYTATRIIKFVDDKFIDWCGEDNDANGFCPVDFYVPEVHLMSKEFVDGAEELITKWKDGREDKSYHWKEYVPFGFVMGCIWGDDSSWKLQYLDFTQLDQKILNRDERFGYLPMASVEKTRLKDLVEVGVDDYYDVKPHLEKSYTIELAVRKFCRMKNDQVKMYED